MKKAIPETGKVMLLLTFTSLLLFNLWYIYKAVYLFSVLLLCFLCDKKKMQLFVYMLVLILKYNIILCFRCYNIFKQIKQVK